MFILQFTKTPQTFHIKIPLNLHFWLKSLTSQLIFEFKPQISIRSTTKTRTILFPVCAFFGENQELTRGRFSTECIDGDETVVKGKCDAFTCVNNCLQEQ